MERDEGAQLLDDLWLVRLWIYRMHHGTLWSSCGASPMSSSWWAIRSENVPLRREYCNSDKKLISAAASPAARQGKEVVFVRKIIDVYAWLSNQFWRSYGVFKDIVAELQDLVRLVNGSHQCAGRVEVYHNGEWGTVCDDGWGLEEAEVVCREIGCGSAVSAPGSAAFGKGTGMIWLDDVVCTPAAPSIFNCMAKTLGNANCGHIEDAGVVCSGKFLVLQDQVRLVNGPNQCSGRVEVYHSGEWGTVCDDDWGMKDAEVVCRQIGCRSAVSAPGSARFGQGTGRIWLDDVACTPAAASIFNCMGTPWGAHNCDHGEDAGVVCSASFQSFSPSGVSAQTTVLNSVKAGSDVTLPVPIGTQFRGKEESVIDGSELISPTSPASFQSFSSSRVSAKTTVLNSVKTGSDVTLPVNIGTQFRGREESVTDGSELISIVFTTDSGSYTISNPTSPGEIQMGNLLWVNDIVAEL
nr:PREDICTED: deleted in malignant brain tumors 1 protein-like [Latimeria chalumnae]|eukprot:XP_014339550.1 PREDICTED: deleted in malignant brain tumors 1 protein-like [Latimeria chalumnae]